MSTTESRTIKHIKDQMEFSDAVRRALTKGHPLPKVKTLRSLKNDPSFLDVPKNHSANSEKLTRSQRLLRHGLPVAALLAAAGTIAGVEASSSGESLPKSSEVLLARLVINGANTGVNLHSSPSLDNDPTNVGVSDNIIDRIEPGHAFTVDNPLVVQEKGASDNSTTWYGFSDPNVKKYVWVDGTKLLQDQLISGTNYLNAEVLQGSAANIDLTSPDGSLQATAHLNSSGNQYQIAGQNVAVGVPSLTKQISYK